MEDYASNSHMSKGPIIDDPIDVESKTTDSKPAEKVVKGKIKVKKKSALKKWGENFIQEDAQNVKNYVFGEVLIPALKKAISDVVTNSIDMFLYGETGHTKRYSSASKVSYRSYYDDRRDDRRNYTSRSSRDFDFDEFEMSHDDAKEVLARMDETLERYGTVSVLDYYDFCGVTGRHTDQKYGWTDLRTAGLARTRDGWVIKLPKAIPID